MRESAYRNKLVKKLERLLPDAMILKNDPDYVQGIPDLTILWGSHWAMLELKVDEQAQVQPNQEYWVERLGHFSFCAFIYPENEEEILDALQDAFGIERQTRIS